MTGFQLKVLQAVKDGSEAEKLAFVSVLNFLIEQYCTKYPDEYNFDEQSVGLLDGEITCYNGDSIEDTIDWIVNDIIPDIYENGKVY